MKAAARATALPPTAAHASPETRASTRGGTGAITSAIREALIPLIRYERAVGVPACEITAAVNDAIRFVLEEQRGPAHATSEEGIAWLISVGEGCCSVEEARTLYRKPKPATAQATIRGIRTGTLIAYRTRDGRYLIPRWQFSPEGGTLDGLPRVLGTLRGIRGFSDLTPFVFLLQPNPLTGGETPLEALKAGRIDQVVHAAEVDVG